MKAILLFLIDHFPDLLDINLTASIVILFVICVRQLLKGAPKIFSYALWGIVLLRLLVPVSIESPMSFVPERTEFSSMVDINEALPEIEFETARDRESNRWERENTPPGEVLVQTSKTMDAQTYLTFGWLIGVAAMLLCSFVSWWKLRRRVKVRIPFQKGIYIADDINTPFVMGFFRPVIYLPGTLDPAEREYIIAHERHHIRRGDHIFKALGFLALSIHWFNPLVWAAFVLAGRDMEMSCDEAVIRKLGEEVRAEYSASLLNLAAGRRLFVGTPLAFGESDPAGRVRNLEKWRKPAFWVILLCVVLCVVLAVCLLTDPQVTHPSEDDWGVSIVPERVSRTGATAVFNYDAQDGAELYYGEFLSLERLDNGTWVEVEALPGYEYFVGDAIYPVVDGYGMVHDWQDRFGELPDGDYRLGKQVILERSDGTREERILYGAFSLPEAILTGPIPLNQLPEVYSAEQAMIDGCLVQEDGVVRYNQELFHTFAADSWNGEPGFIRIVNWHYGEDSHWNAIDLSFDGTVYTITGDSDSYTYRYLKHYTGEKAWENADHDAFEYYVLVNDDSVTWEDIASGKLNGQDDGLAHWTVYAEFTYLPDRPQIPANLAQAVLVFEGEPLVTITDFDRLEKLYLLFFNAELLGYEPKTHSIGVGLDLVLTSQSGETVTIELDPDDDICRVDGEFVFYGAYDEPSYIEKLWYYLDIAAWPDAVYEKYPNAFRP